MARLTVMAAVLAVGTLALQGAVAEQMKQSAGDEGMKVTGMVTEVDKDSKQITVDDQTFIMPEESAGASLMPQVGAEVTLYYEENGGKKTITRIGQAQQ